MDSFGNRNRDLATALTALVATDHPVISEVTPLLENFVENVPLADADINVVVREGWFQLICRGTTILRLAHPHATATPTETQRVISTSMHLLDVLLDQIVNEDLLEIFIAEIPGFEDAHYCVFVADLCYNSDENIEDGDLVQIAAATMMNEVARNERRHDALRSCHEYAEFVQFIQQTQAGIDLATAFRRNLMERFDNDQYPHRPLTPEEISNFLF